jgi:hypothetical protein
MGAPLIRSDDMFQPLTAEEIDLAVRSAIAHSISLMGKSDDGVTIIVKARSTNSDYTAIGGLLKTSSRIANPQQAVFSFVVGENKYLFKAIFKLEPGKKVNLTLVSTFYCIQRRANERLRIPHEYYALFKFTHINGRPFRSFGKIKNISAGGAAVVFRNTNPKIVHGDTIRGVLTLSCRPPEDIELKIKHVVDEKEGEINVQIFGGAFAPEGSSLMIRRMTSVIADIYRDIFKSLDEKKRLA